MPSLRLLLLAVLPSLAACANEASQIPPGDVSGGETDPAAPQGGAEGRDARNAPAPAASGAPRLVFPAPGTTATSSTPNLRWALPAGATGAHVTICRDRTCTAVEHDLAAPGTSVRVPRALGRGLHFVKLAAVSASGDVASSAVVAPIRVRARPSTIDTAWGASPDFDGDGFSDLATAEGGAVTVRRGSPRGLSAEPDAILTLPAGASLVVPASAGDVNGDGFGDMLVAYVDAEQRGRVALLLGSEAGLSGRPDWFLAEASSAAPPHAAGAGDLDGDGFADVVVTTGSGDLLVFRGSEGSLRGVPDAVLAGAYDDVAPAGDVNGDGFADLLARRHAGEKGDAPVVDVLAGSARGLVKAPLATLTAASAGASSRFAVAFASAGDVDGDGLADVAIAETTSLFPWRVHVYAGAALASSTAPSWVVPSPAYAGSKGATLAPAGDVNGDGFDDLFVGSPESLYGVTTVQPLLTRAVLVPGGAAGPSAGAAQSFGLAGGVTDFDGSFGATVAGLGDVDGDGFADVFLGVGQVLSPALITQSFGYVHRGSAAGASTSPSATVAGAPGDALFGRGIARAF